MHPTAILLIIGAVVAPLCALAWHPSTLRFHEPQQPPLPRVRLTCREIGFDAVLTHPDAAAWAASEAAILRHDPLCRGIVLLGLSAPQDEVLAGIVAAARKLMARAA